MSKVTLRKPGSPKASFVAVETKENGDVYVSRWKEGAKAAKGINFPAASFAPTSASERRDAIVKEEAANGYVLQHADFKTDATVYSFMLTLLHETMPHALKVFEAFGIAIADPTSTAQQAVIGSEFVIKRTVNDIRITAALSCDRSDPVQNSILLRHLAIARCLSTDAEVFENTQTQIDPIKALKRARLDLDESVLEPLYCFGVLRRPVDLSREFTGAAATPFAVGF